jgi:hypothetical protein
MKAVKKSTDFKINVESERTSSPARESPKKGEKQDYQAETKFRAMMSEYLNPTVAK